MRKLPAQVAVDELADGRIALTFARIEELVAWVLSFGGSATIESPPSAREALRAAAERIVLVCSFK